MRPVATNLVVLAVVAALCASCGQARHEPAVPLRVQQKLAKLYPGMAYVPDIAFVKSDSGGNVVRAITFSVQPTAYVAPGLEGANPNEAFQILSALPLPTRHRRRTRSSSPMPSA